MHPDPPLESALSWQFSLFAAHHNILGTDRDPWRVEPRRGHRPSRQYVISLAHRLRRAESEPTDLKRGIRPTAGTDLSIHVGGSHHGAEQLSVGRRLTGADRLDDSPTRPRRAARDGP